MSRLTPWQLVFRLVCFQEEPNHPSQRAVW
jgi:hypothetical protein